MSHRTELQRILRDMESRTAVKYIPDDLNEPVERLSEEEYAARGRQLMESHEQALKEAGVVFTHGAVAFDRSEVRVDIVQAKILDEILIRSSRERTAFQDAYRTSLGKLIRGMSRLCIDLAWKQSLHQRFIHTHKNRGKPKRGHPYRFRPR